MRKPSKLRHILNSISKVQKALVDECYIGVEESGEFAISNGGQDIKLLMPLKGVTDGCDFIILFSFVNCGKVEVSINIEEGDFSFDGLFYLIEMDFVDGERMFDCEVEWFSSCDFVELNHFGVG